MSDQTLNHPQREQLLEYGLGKLDPDKSDLIELHLAECDQCGETLLNLQDDTFVNLIRRSDAIETPTENSEPERAEDHPQASVMGATLVEGSAASEGELDLPASLADHPRYRIVDLLGKGGMGDVYQAEHIVMNRPVALKIINRELVKKSQAVERFRREVHAAARLSHPNIVTAHDAEQAGDLHFLVMEFVDGIDLSRLVKERGALPVHEACDYARQAALGMQHAHEQGMVHRDIKPHNLMVTADGTVKILDFGLAGFATETALIEAEESEGAGSDSIPLHLTTVGSVMGTPDYIAPEQACDAHSADIRADVYSLGCTLYFLLTGQPPHNATTVIEKLQAHAEHEPPAIESIRVDVPDELAEVIRRMMAKELAERFQTPQEVADALVPFVDKYRTEDQNRPPTQSAGSGSRRVPRKLAWFAFFGFFACLAAVVLYIELGKTTLRFEIHDPSISVSFGDEVIEVKTPDEKVFRVKPSTEQKFVILQNGTEVETASLKLRWGQKVALKIDVVNGKVAITANDRDIEIGRKPQVSQPKPTPDEYEYASADTRHKFETLIAAARRASTEEEWAQVLAKHAPTLALTEESETEQFGKAEMALMREGGRILIELLAGLPDAVHNDLLQSGYLKWSFKELDEPRREAMQDALTNVISASDKMGFPAGLKNQVPEMLASGDVGFAVADTPKGQELVWYLLVPEAPLPMLLPLFGTPHEGEGKGVSLTKSVYKQIGELENKPYSELLTLLKATDMQRLQGVWTFVRGEANGKPSTPRTLEIAANVWLLKDPQTGRTIQRMTFDIDPTQNPRHITVTSADFPQPMKGIYQFDGDELHITSASAPGGERPTEFDQGGAGKFFVVMRREPPPDQKRISMEQTLERLQKERDASQEIGFAVWEADGKAVLRFANWLLVFEGIDAAPGLGGFSSFRVPHERYDDSQREGGGVTFGTDDSSLKLTIDQRIIDGVGHITVNDFRFRMEGRAEKLLFESETYSADSDVQTIVVRASGKTKLLNAKTRISLLNFQWSLIPAGEFQMGTANQNVNALSPDENWFFADFVPDRRQAETPQHRVSITKPFMMSKHEVTVGQFRQFVETTGYKTTAEMEREGYGWKDAEWQEGVVFNWQNPGFEQGNDHPVCNVSWEDAVAFCRWLSSQDGQTYRLPTEAEWEYACRAGTTTLFSTGDDPDSLQGFANLADATLRKQYANVNWAVDWEDGFAATSPVGSFKPNQFGLYDMHGNVWEWCQDVYDTEWYETSPESDPLHKRSSGTHVFRGGGFDNWPGFLRSADRYSSHSPTLRSQWAGFRVVRALEEGRSQIPNR